MDDDTFIDFVVGDIAISGARSDVQVQCALLPHRGSGIKLIAGEVDGWRNLHVEEIEGCADFPEEDFDLWRDVDAACGAFKSELYGCSHQCDSEELHRSLYRSVDVDIVVAITESLCSVSIEAADFEIGGTGDAKSLRSDLNGSAECEFEFTLGAEVAVSVD